MLNETNKHSWCVNAFHAMSANNDGSTKMCCMIESNYNRLLLRDDLNVGVNLIEKNFNNPIATIIREHLDHGFRHKACSLCWQEEDAGRKSKRMRDNERYLHELKYEKIKPYQNLAKFELNLGNNCNIKCRTCDPSISSTWMKESYDLNYQNKMSFKSYSDSMKRFHKQYDEDSPFWNDLINHLSTIRQFDFYGGEPFLSKKMWSILKTCVKEGYSKNIELHYNTNGTTWPEEIEELWPEFKIINLSFSIDGINDTFEYTRFPAKWDVVTKNMIKARNYKEKNNNMSISWCVTLSNINIYNLPEIIDEHRKNYSDFGIYLNLVHGPAHFNISKLPDKLKKIVINKINNIPKEINSVCDQIPGIINFISNGKEDLQLWKEFLNVISKHDAYRKQNFFETYKEYGKYISN